MRLLALVTDGYGISGGIATYNRHLLVALAQSYPTARIVVLPRHGLVEAPGCPPNVRQLAPEAPRFYYVLKALWLACHGERFDAVFCGHLRLAPLAGVAAWLNGAPLWLQLHGWEAWHKLTRGQIWAARRAALITVVSRYTRRRFLSLLRVDNWRIRVLSNTLDAAFGPGPKSNYLLERHGLHRHKVLLTVGRLATSEANKGQDRVIRALPAIAECHPDVVYLIAGQGDDRARLEALTAELGIKDRVLLVGPVPAEELVDYYRAADVFVMPSTQEGFGIVFIEAAACGLRPIGGNRDGSLDALADGAIGRAVDPEDQPQLVRAIVECLDGVEGAPERVERFRFGAFAEHVDVLMQELLRRDRSAMVTA